MSTPRLPRAARIGRRGEADGIVGAAKPLAYPRHVHLNQPIPVMIERFAPVIDPLVVAHRTAYLARVNR